MTPRTARAIATGTLVVGALDLLDAVVFFGLRGARPDRILQSIAAGVLGPASFQGGAATALLGLALHFVIAFGIVMVYFIAAGWFPFLVRRPIVHGAWYGVVAYLVMNFVVIPLSNAAAGPRSVAVVVNGLLIHILGVGIPAAWFASRARRPASGSGGQ
ncbi:MAG: hypothetical protein SFV24_15885 [Gemmatimonadales bacterium]|nr:hypothetical protein [Gemmatimonadales bacterium]